MTWRKGEKFQSKTKTEKRKNSVNKIQGMENICSEQQAKRKPPINYRKSSSSSNNKNDNIFFTMKLYTLKHYNNRLASYIQIAESNGFVMIFFFYLFAVFLFCIFRFCLNRVFVPFYFLLRSHTFHQHFAMNHIQYIFFQV